MDSSLRTRRPSKQPQRSPSKLSKLTNRDARKSRVDDKIKKRMSMRYADISSPTELSPIPPIPHIPIPHQPSSFRSRTQPRQDEDLRDRNPYDGTIAPEDKKLLSSESFDPDAFLKLKLANSTEAELRSLQSSLRTAKNDTASDLQRSVFKNYAEFVLISKEISVLDNEMLELKDLLSEYKSMPSVLHVPDPTSASTGTLSIYKRSSVADLRILYFNQMQELHSSIEGAAKFVPTTPGRHVVGEMDGVYSLNAATYKVIGKVKFVILDDAVLLARRRRRNAGGGGDGSTVNEGKLVAERCWSLNDMLVLDTKDSPNMTNVFKIRQGKETHVYRTETPADKKALLIQFRQVADELAAKKRKEREGEHERRKSMWHGGDNNSAAPPPMPEWLADLAKRGGDFPGANSDDDAKAKAEKDTRWVGEWSDELTVAIALREWTKAVELVEQGQSRLATMPLLQSKLPQLTTQLTSSLLASLSLSSNRKSACVTLISLLIRLKSRSAARKAFLEMRTNVITTLMRRIRFEGDVSSYVGELSVVWFTGIKHTSDWYLASFKENESASAFVVWAQEQLKVYAEMFRKQVFTKDVKPAVVQDATAIAQIESRKLLQEHGMDFRHLLDQLLVEKPKEVDTGATSFSLAAHRTSRHGDLASLAKQLDSSQLQNQPVPKSDIISTQSPKLPPAPAPPTLSAPPPPNRRRSPAPPSSFRDNQSDKPRSETPPSTEVFSPLSSASVYPPSPAYPIRNRTPVSATPNFSSPSLLPPIPLSANAALSSTPVALGSSPRRARSPPLTPGSRNAFGSVRERNFVDADRDRERDWETSSAGGSIRARSIRNSPIPAPLPPRSTNRPGSQMGSSTSIPPMPKPAVAQREGMI